MKKFKYFLVILLLPFLGQGTSQTVDIADRLLLRNRLLLSSEKLAPFLYDRDVGRRLNRWLMHSQNQSYAANCVENLKAFFPAAKIMGGICYYLRQKPELRKKALEFIELFLLEYQSALGELSEDPRYERAEWGQAQYFWTLMEQGPPLVRIEKCLTGLMAYNYRNDNEGQAPFARARACIMEEFKDEIVDSQNLPYFSMNIAELFSNHPGHTISETGWTTGNTVEYFTQNDTSAELGKKLESSHELIPNLYPVDGRGSLQAMLEADLSQVFTEAEGIAPVAKHLVWGQRSGIFYELIKGMNSAQESIFIDIFFLGGTMGASLAKHLVYLMESKPKLKVLILRDDRNHFGHEVEMRPIFNFLLAYSYLNPSRLVLLPAHIASHRSALPKFLWGIVNDEAFEKLGLRHKVSEVIKTRLPLDARGISDHSKVMVIDGKTANPVAYVGSKNWLDSSGGVCFDEVAKVSGPAAAIVQDDYYYDMVYAFRHEADQYIPNYTNLLFKQGWAKGKPERANLDAKIAAILQPFDLLDRDAEGRATRTQVVVVQTGSAEIRTGFNNVNSTRTNALDQVLQTILFAKKNIYIKDQFLFERNIIRALLQAKAQNPKLDIKVILEPLEIATPPGMPNLLYLDVLAAAGIEVKWKLKTVEHSVIAQEYHMKTVSADGTFIISGSANKDQSTMFGSFREQQLDIFDSGAAKLHDDAFLAEWNDAQSTSSVFQDFDFKVPGDLKGLDGKPMSPQQFIALVRNILSILYDSTAVY